MIRRKGGEKTKRKPAEEGGMGKKKKSGSRFSLSSVLPIAWFPKLRWAERNNTGRKNNLELSLPGLSVGEERLHSSDDYMHCRAEEYDLPRSSYGSCRLSVSIAEVAPIFTEMLADAKRSTLEAGGAFPLLDPVKVPDKENGFPQEEEKQIIMRRASRSPVEVLAVECPEFSTKDSSNFQPNKGALDESLLDPVLLPETASTMDLRPRNGFDGGCHPSPESVTVPESVSLLEARRSRNCRDRSNDEDFMGPHLVLLRQKEAQSVDGGTESILHAERSIRTNRETFQAKEAAKLREMEKVDGDWTACTGSKVKLAGQFQSFPGESLRVLQQRERLQKLDVRKEAEEVIPGHADGLLLKDTDGSFLNGKVNRLPSLYSILFPEEEKPRITISGGNRTKGSGSIKPNAHENHSKSSSSALSRRESAHNKKTTGEFATRCARAEIRSTNENRNFPPENYCHLANESRNIPLENYYPFKETGCKMRSSRGWTRSIGSEVDLVAREFGNLLSTDSVAFPNEVRNVAEMKNEADEASDRGMSEVLQSAKGRVEQSLMRETVLFAEKGRTKSMFRQGVEAELSTRTFECDTPRRRSFKGRRKLKNARVTLRSDNEKSPRQVQGFRTEEERKKFELKITKILGFDPKTLDCGDSTAKEATFKNISLSGNSVSRNSGSSDPKISFDHRSAEGDHQNCIDKTLCDRKTVKENEFKSLLLRKLGQKRPELMQKRMRQSRDPELPKAKQRPKIKVSSPRVEIRARKSFQGERRKKETAAVESFAVVKRSFDPQEDFRESMVEMISQNGIGKPEELENLLASYLSLNSDEHHDIIVKVFRQVWFDLSRVCLVSDYLDLEGNQRV